MAKLPAFLKEGPKILGMDLKDVLVGGVFSLFITFLELPPYGYLLSFVVILSILSIFRSLGRKGKTITPLLKTKELVWVEEE